MDGEIDYKKYDESELVDMFSRTDPRAAPVNYARLKELLVERGYIVREGGLGPGSAVPSPEKLQLLIGSARPFECKVAFGQKAGIFSALEPSHDGFNFGNSGTLSADGIHLRLSGRRAGLPGLFGKLLIEMRARRDCCGAFGPLASLTLGSPFGRPPSPLRGAVVELGLFYVGSSN
jgi:hypothetical protein